MKTSKNQKASEMKSGGLKGAIIFSLFLIVISSIAGIPLSNASGRLQYEIVELSAHKQELLEENETLQSEVWDLSSLNHLGKKAEEFRMGPVSLKELKVIAPEVIQEDDEDTLRSSVPSDLPLDATSTVPSANPVPSVDNVAPTTAPSSDSNAVTNDMASPTSEPVVPMPEPTASDPTMIPDSSVQIPGPTTQDGMNSDLSVGHNGTSMSNSNAALPTPDPMMSNPTVSG